MGGCHGIVEHISGIGVRAWKLVNERVSYGIRLRDGAYCFDETFVEDLDPEKADVIQIRRRRHPLAPWEEEIQENI